MGYITDYEIKIDAPLEVDKGYLAYRLEKDTGFDFQEHEGSFRLYGFKWYEHEEDLLKFSLDFPAITLYVKGTGESQGDIWEKHFREGKIIKHKKARLIMEEV